MDKIEEKGGLFSDEWFMKQALQQAKLAMEDDEVPIGAVVVSKDRIIGKGYNQVERLKDATAHAEMIALTSAFNFLGSKYLPDCRIYVTIEPCVMCAGAMRWAQISGLIYGAPEPKTGYSRLGDGLLHPKTIITEGILAEEAATLMRAFFQNKRG